MHKWQADPTKLLLLSECVNPYSSETTDMITTAYKFLSNNAYINWGYFRYKMPG